MFDKDLIEASFATQYGIRLRQEPDIAYAEWAQLLSGLMGETPLGKVVQIRAEKDMKTIQRFGPWERRVRKEWDEFCAKNRTAQTVELDFKELQSMLARMFS